MLMDTARERSTLLKGYYLDLEHAGNFKIGC